MTFPLVLLNRSFQLENEAGLALSIKSDLSKDLFCFQVRQFEGEETDIKDNDNQNKLFSHCMSLELSEPPTFEELKKCFEYIFLVADRYYCCLECDEMFYDELYHGQAESFKCSNCIIHTLYMSYKKKQKNPNVIQCKLCDKLDWKKDAQVNTCCQTEENKFFICEHCLDKIHLEEDAEENLFYPCPFCRGALKRLE